MCRVPDTYQGLLLSAEQKVGNEQGPCPHGACSIAWETGGKQRPDVLFQGGNAAKEKAAKEGENTLGAGLLL